MKFVFRGEYSRTQDSVTLFGVTFNGREPSDVTEGAAINWFVGNPDFEAVADEEVKPVKAKAKK